MPHPTGGRPQLVGWPGLVTGQVVKPYGTRRGRRGYRRVVGVVRWLVQGSEAALPALLALTQGGGVLNAAYIERLNETFH